MPTTYTDQFYIIDPGNPPPAGTVLNFTTYDLVDRDDDLDIGSDGRDSIDGRDVRAVYNGDTITVENPDGTIQTITGVTFYLQGGIQVFTPTDGTILQNGAIFLSSSWVNTSTQLDVGDLGPACFTPGTLIDTPQGPRPIETLQEGDLVLTRDNGPQPILWISRRRADGSGDHAPIRIGKGVIGNDRDLLVSPQHRVMIDGWRAELLYGQDEVLVAAKHLVGVHDQVHVDRRREVEYIHLLLDGHHLIWSEGALTESFDPGGDFALYDPTVQSEVEARYPGLIQDRGRKGQTARPVIQGYEALALVA
ncbi:Hint domain-containing protein [Loktanella sp. IMCC34160]|uniref:Hint domain-containing protein n=1 Tax=Loktanella sp. IMCC34160 TaxID=2510646 RepID=UPI00101CA61E|nr:Hint domain-containing protein [Loktanella sp. IMCC34160]RYG91233.1 Hint domain-containing protein [Loktanella sp. IMCC34160]